MSCAVIALRRQDISERTVTLAKIKYTFIEPRETKSDKVKCVIQLVPILKRNVGIGYIVEREATPEDFAKYPIVNDPWINKEGF